MKDCIQIKRNIKSLAAFRDAILKVSTNWNSKKSGRAFLILVEPQISEDTLAEEWSKAQEVLSKSIASHLCLGIIKNGQLTKKIEKPPSSLSRKIESLCREENVGRHLKRPKYEFEVLKLLVRHWLLGKGPVPTSWLMKNIGCSYPTAAKALDSMQGELRYGAYKRVELAHFPHKAWNELLVLSDKVRATVRYVDVSGQPRSPQSLLRRLRKLSLGHIAVGGTMGAREWYPLLGETEETIDLEGDPRLDLAVHESGNSIDLSFVEMLDPALREVEDVKEPARLVVHVVRRVTPFFEHENAVGVLADPVECLLDLHDLRLESQAREFVKFLREMRRDNGCYHS